MRHVRSAQPLTICLSLLVLLRTASAEPSQWQLGDLFLGVGDGTYDVYDRRLWVQSGSQSTGDDELHTIARPQTIETGEVSPGGHAGAVAFDEAGNLFVGHPDDNSLIHKYGPSGGLIETFDCCHLGTAVADFWWRMAST